MKEGIASRVGRIISGGFNQLVDAVENAAPEAVMEQAVREVDAAIDDVRAELGKVLANKHLAAKRLMGANTKHEDLAAKVELAITEDREDLAEAAIAQQLDLEAQIPILESTVQECGEQEKELEGFIEALQAKKREMSDELREFRRSSAEAEATTSAVSTGSGPNAAVGVYSRVAKAESAFDRVLERQTGAGASPSDLKIAGRLAELEKLSRHNRIQERLAAAKAKAKKD
jgi:phage shock protein A